MPVNEKVLDVITKMPDNSTLDDIGYELYVIDSVQKRLDELDRGEYLTHEQAKEKLQKWVKQRRVAGPTKPSFKSRASANISSSTRHARSSSDDLPGAGHDGPAHRTQPERPPWSI